MIPLLEGFILAAKYVMLWVAVVGTLESADQKAKSSNVLTATAWVICVVLWELS